MDVTSKIVRYIADSKISLYRVEQDTGISISKLSGDSNKKLSAGEFLEICRYLNINPVDIGNDRI